MGTLGREMLDPVREAAEDRDPIKAIMAPINSAARLLLQGPDYLWHGIVDKKIEPIKGSETLHDAGEVAKNIVTLHPFRALVGALKLPGDIGMDIVKGVGGFEGSSRMPAQMRR